MSLQCTASRTSGKRPTINAAWDKPSIPIPAAWTPHLPAVMQDSPEPHVESVDIETELPGE
jgi:hypothetical protein